MSSLALEPATAQEWDAAWSACPWATYFQSRAWAQTWAAEPGSALQPAGLRATLPGGATAVLAASSVPLVRGRFGRRLVLSPAGTYGGWISADELTADDWRALRSAALDQAGDIWWRANPYEPPPADWMPPGVRADTTQAVDLRDGFDAALQRWRKGHRHAVRVAERAGVTCALAGGTDDWRAYFEVYRATVERWGEAATNRYEWPLFERLAEDREHVSLWLARDTSGRIVAGALCLYALKHVSYWHGAALAEAFDQRPVNLLMYAAMQDAAGRGIDWFDMNPSGGNEGVAAFKSHHGAVALPCPVLERQSAITRLAGLAGRGGA